MRLLFLQILLALSALVFSQTPRDRVQIKNGTLVTDKGTLLRGAFYNDHSQQGDMWEYSPVKEDLSKVKDYGLNCIHIYHEDANVGDPGYWSPVLDSVVKWTEELGLYLIIVPGWWGGLESDFVYKFWSFYASRYKNEPHVIFEICNEPFMAGYPYTEVYDSLTIAMERAAYDTIRFHAPETHIIFMSYPFAKKNYDFMQDIRSLGNGIDWSNASIGIHGYGVSSEDCRIFIQNIKDSGYAVIDTESPTLRFYDSSPDLYVNLAFLRVFEEETVSYINFLTPRHLVDKSYLYKSKIESSEIRWAPDFGTWPESLTGINYPSPYTTLMTGFYDEAADINPHDSLTLWYLPHNAYIAFYNLDFESGADTIQITCSSEFTNSKIRIHIDSINGELIGTFPLPVTGRDDDKKYSFAVKKVEGVHKIYLVIESTISRFNTIIFKKAGLPSDLLTKSDHRKVVVYPNPASNIINIEYASKIHCQISYSLKDMSGKIIQQSNILDNSIDISGISTGIYILKLYIDGEIFHSKIIIE